MVDANSMVVDGGFWAHIPAWLDRWDLWLTRVVSGWIPTQLNDALIVIQESPWMVVIILLSLAPFVFIKKTPLRYMFIIGLILMALLDIGTNVWIKPFFGRVKPFISAAAFERGITVMSFPSSHAANTAFMWAFLSPHPWLSPILGWLFVIVSILRVICFRHFALDVIGGGVLGITTGIICRAGVEYFVRVVFGGRRTAYPRQFPNSHTPPPPRGPRPSRSQ